ncbi:MAG TPA: Gfo/Idh/MocA family oxidoreductase [Chitinispirillaceae bacterium]|nr:Gfo/Idh/MocA family oxidoreductase [Chitinispirillaceae bacterium]
MRIYNWGILGPGRIAAKFASDLQLLPNARLHAVASKSSQRAETFAQQFGIKKTYCSYDALAADPDIDIVYIATLHTGHYHDSLLCLNHEKHVLCEKPIAINNAQFEKMVSLASQKKVFFMEALWTRFIPSFMKCIELLESGEIGDLRIVCADFCINPPYSDQSRLFNLNIGGGSLLDIGIYPVFLALECAGIPHTIKAAATIDKNGVDTICSVIMQHEKGIHSLLYSASTTKNRTEATLCGSKGSLKLNRCFHTPTTLELIHDTSKNPTQFSFEQKGFGYQYEAAEVMRCCDLGLKQSPLWPWEKSRRLISILDTIRLQTGIRYPDTVESTDSVYFQ